TTAIAHTEKPDYKHPMIRQYERYVFFHLLWPTLLITLSLTGIVWLTQALRFVDFMLNRGLALSDFMYLTGLMLPALLLMIIPIALAMAVIYTINRLTADSELIVLYAVGVSKLQVMRPVLMMGAVCMLICYALALYLMPLANGKFQDIRTFFRDKYASVLLEEEVFNSPVDGMTVFVRQRDDHNVLRGVLLHDNRNPKETVTLLAETGRIEQTPTGPRFNLVHGVRQTLKNGRVSWLSFDNYGLDVAFYAKNAERKQTPDERTITELFHTEGMSEKDTRAYRAEGHYRISWPLLNIALPMAVLAVLFSGFFNRRGQWRRSIGAALTVAVIVVSYFALRSMAVKMEAVQPVLYFVVLLPAVIAWRVVAREMVIAMPRFSFAAAKGV
ncbi:MAG: LPS export ABC transporter permease LptF, partial [Rhodospirillales bacterium 12-54-5]